MMKLFVLFAALLAGSAQAGIYRCEGPSGTAFQDEPCEGSGEAVTLELTNTYPARTGGRRWSPARPIYGGRARHSPEGHPRDEAVILEAIGRRHVVGRMTRTEVERSWGRPSWVDRSGETTTLIYDRYRTRQFVHLTNNQVTRIETFDPIPPYWFDCRTNCMPPVAPASQPQKRGRAPGAVITSSKRHSVRNWP
jgi:hypothetical protein